MWQGYTFQFRIRGVGKVYVTGFIDDCSRYRVNSKVYLRKDAASAVNALRWALRAGRIPREIFLDNGHKTLLPGAYRPQGIPLVKPLQSGTLELRPPVQQLAEAGDPRWDDSSLSLSQRNQFQQKPKIYFKRTKTLSTKRTLILALYTYNLPIFVFSDATYKQNRLIDIPAPAAYL